MATQIISYDGFVFTDEVAVIGKGDPNRVPMGEVPKRHGGLIQDVPVRGIKRVSFSGTIFGKDYDVTNPAEGARSRVDQYLRYSMRFNKQLKFYSDRYLKAYPTGFASQPREGSANRVIDFSWEFACADPFEYGDPAAPTVVTLTVADPIGDITAGYHEETFNIDNVGSVFIYPKVTVVCSHAASKRFRLGFFNLTTGKSWTYEFDYVGGTTRTIIVDAGLFSVTNDGTDDLTNWGGTFVWLDPGVNNMKVLGSVDATYTIEWTARYQ